MTAKEMAAEVINKLDDMAFAYDPEHGQLPCTDEKQMGLMVDAVVEALERFATEEREAVAKQLDGLAEKYKKEADGESLNASLSLSGRAEGLIIASFVLRTGKVP